jgi:SAM-dependent methyltransferase
LVDLPRALRCARCSLDYEIRNEKIYFIEPASTDDALDFVKSQLKRHLGSYYYTVGVTLLAPSFPFNYGGEIRRHIQPQNFKVIDLGCGNRRIDENIVTIDSADYDAVDIVADITALPLQDGAIDAVCTRHVLEHVPELDRAVCEIIRCTKRGGLGIHMIPFMCPYHASPHDYTRLTHVGAAHLFRGWTVIRQTNTTGPVSLFLYCLIEFLASLLSFGHERAKAILFLLFCPIFSPLKIFDAPFIGRKSFIGLALHILTIVRKP